MERAPLRSRFGRKEARGCAALASRGVWRAMDASRQSRVDGAELRLTRQPLAASAAPLKMCAAAHISCARLLTTPSPAEKASSLAS